MEWISTVWNLVIDFSQIIGGIGIFIAVIEYRMLTHKRVGSPMSLRTISIHEDGTSVTSVITNTGPSPANIISVSQRDANFGEVAAFMPHVFKPGDTVEVTFEGCNAASCIWIAYSPQDEAEKIRFAYLPLFPGKPIPTESFSRSNSPRREYKSGVRYSRWHHGDHLGELGKNVVWIKGQGNWKRTLRELGEIYADIQEQGGNFVPLGLSREMIYTRPISHTDQKR